MADVRIYTILVIVHVIFIPTGRQAFQSGPAAITVHIRSAAVWLWYPCTFTPFYEFTMYLAISSAWIERSGFGSTCCMIVLYKVSRGARSQQYLLYTSDRVTAMRGGPLRDRSSQLPPRQSRRPVYFTTDRAVIIGRFSVAAKTARTNQMQILRRFVNFVPSPATQIAQIWPQVEPPPMGEDDRGQVERQSSSE